MWSMDNKIRIKKRNWNYYEYWFVQWDLWKKKKCFFFTQISIFFIRGIVGFFIYGILSSWQSCVMYIRMMIFKHYARIKIVSVRLFFYLCMTAWLYLFIIFWWYTLLWNFFLHPSIHPSISCLLYEELPFISSILDVKIFFCDFIWTQPLCVDLSEDLWREEEMNFFYFYVGMLENHLSIYWFCDNWDGKFMSSILRLMLWTFSIFFFS